MPKSWIWAIGNGGENEYSGLGKNAGVTLYSQTLGDWGGKVQAQGNCNQKTIIGSNIFPGDDYEIYQPGELWNGLRQNRSGDPLQVSGNDPGECHNWYNPSLDEIENKDKNNCTQYLLKWAKSCKWCKDNSILSNDYLQNCKDPGKCGTRKCAGECRDGTCSLYLNENSEEYCKLCNSSLWNQIPGGWEALVDDKHPYHEMAKFSYVPKVIKTDCDTGSGDCQPTTTILDQANSKPILVKDENDNISNSKSTTTFTSLGKYENQYLFKDNKFQYYSGNKANNLYFSNTDKNAAKFSWSDNLNIKPTGINNPTTTGICRKPNQNSNNISNESIWFGLEQNKYTNSNYVRDCYFKEGSGGFEYNPRAHTICERNSNLTGYGNCDTENAYLALLWSKGKWDLTKEQNKEQNFDKCFDNLNNFNFNNCYNDLDLVDENLSQEEINKRNIEGLRCCLGLDPEYSTNDKTQLIPKI